MFAQVPNTMPSLRCSIAGAVTPFEKPVIGTSAPAPAQVPNLSYMPKPVAIAATSIKVDATKEPILFGS